MDEDTGNAAHNAKVWLYDIATDSLTQLAKHDPARFGDIGVPPTAPFTVDEESSGILDVASIFGPGNYLVDVQAHYPNGPVLVEGGQLLLLKTNVVTASQAAGVLTVNGSLDADTILVTRHGHTLTVSANGQDLGTFDSRTVDRIRADGGRGDDVLFVAPNVQQEAILTGGLGNDVIFGGGGRSLIIGGAGSDVLIGGSKGDLLISGTTAYDNNEAQLTSILDQWTSNHSYNARVAALRALLNSATVFDDGSTDVLVGGGSLDWFFAGLTDVVLDRHPGEFVN
jgi:hypothetical protein